jgi:hypothetical protein
MRWPSAEERQAISKESRANYFFFHCVGIADGTLFSLAFAPESEDAPDYSGRKYGYSLTTMIVCDHTRRIRKPEQHFDSMQYILEDSAFENSGFMISVFKKPKDQAIPKSHEQFSEKSLPVSESSLSIALES